MTEYERKLKARAADVIPAGTGEPHAKSEALRMAKRFLKIEEHRIRLAHRAGASGIEICRMRSAMLDQVIRFLWDQTLAAVDAPLKKKLPVSVIATGGYGRGIMNPCSDVDLLLLFPGNNAVIGADAAKVIGDFLLFLYDLNFKVGHASRSVGETLRLANEDNETKTTLIESRLITGKPEAFNELKKRFDKECMIGRENEFLKQRQKDLAARHEKNENTPFVQEPQVKTGCGGLRDYQNLVWMSYAKFRTTDLKDLIELGMVSRAGWREMERAYDFLLRVRNELHYTERRASDQLTLRLQGIVATNLGYRQKTILRRIETFMHEYFTLTRDLLQRSSEVMDRFHLQSLDEVKKPRIPLPFLARRAQVKSEKFDGFISKNERLHAEHKNVFKEDPARLMRLFMHTQQRHLRLSPELFQLVQESFRLVDQSFRYNKAIRETFRFILSQKGDVARVFRQMHRVGFLGRYMPEFGALTCLVQHEFFHRYTADEHTLRTIDMLDELGGTTEDRKLDFYQHLFHEMQEPWILYLALLLHDAGRAANTKSHADESTVLADAVCRRHQIKGEARRLLLFLVDNHLLLYRTATTKSLEDPRVIEEFCAVVRNKHHLDALLIMTMADSRGTSEQSWSGYKEASIRQLYHAAVMCLDAPADFMKSASVSLDQLQNEVTELLGSGWDAEIKAHFRNMPRSYFNFRDAGTITAHIRQFREFFLRLVEGDAASALLPVISWTDHADQGFSELIVTSWDRHLLLARISGALSAESINILGADLYQRADNLVLDVFRVCTTSLTSVTSDRAKKRVEAAVNEAFSSEHFDFTARIAASRKATPGVAAGGGEIPQRVYINNEISPDHTIVELQAMDRLGLLHDVFMRIGKLGHNVTHARINTEKGAAIDTIYIQDATGRKITDRDDLLALKEVLERLIGALGPVA